jgi:cytochrome c-type biogenesis protein CcmF
MSALFQAPLALAGTMALAVALASSLVQALPLALPSSRLPAFGRATQRAALVTAALLAAAFALLAAAFAANDFSLRYVVAHSHTALPLGYRIAAVWGGHEGSLLLWLAWLGVWTALLARRTHASGGALHTRALATLGAVAAGLLLLVLAGANPFTPALPAPAQGQDLNPLLQHPAMALHPPMLYLGYAGFAVVYALAVAGLIEGRLDAAWARALRPWAAGAWAALTLGIVLGSRWAYVVLGWGGWWFWDPVENASLMPWLIGTALLHALALHEKRQAAAGWCALLAIVGFSLALLGTFIVRSGVLSSVHAFASDPRRGAMILACMLVYTGGALALHAWRALRSCATSAGAIGPRGSLLLVQSVLMALACAGVLAGTLYPLLADALGWGAASVGGRYFERVMQPVMIVALALLAAHPLVPTQGWRPRRSRISGGWWIALVSPLYLIGGAAAPEQWSAEATLGVLLAVAVLLGVAIDLQRRLNPGSMTAARPQRNPATPRGAPSRSPATPRRALPRHVLGMTLAHLGVAVFALGISLTHTGAYQRDVKLAAGDSAVVGDYRFRLVGLRTVHGPNYEAVQALVEASRAGSVVAQLLPEKRLYRANGQPTTEAAIDAGVARDLYVVLGEPLDGGRAWSLRLYVKPFVDWLWAGCLLMAAGGLLTALMRRHDAGLIAHPTRQAP